jgi:ribonuclease D
VTLSKRARATSPPPLYIESSEAAERFLTSIATTRVIAIDTEGASFHRFVDRIYLLQLSTESQHAILDPLRVGSPPQLGALLESRDVEIVFHDADYDLRLLHQDYGWQVTNIFDTRVAAQLLGIRTFGLAALLDSYFGVKLDKRHQRADWSMRPLTPDMLDYAAQDTMHLLELRQRLRDALEEKGRWHWAQEEFARLEGTQWDEQAADSAFLKLKGARDLSRRDLAHLRELVLWRNDVARELDRSTFRVVTNEVLLDLAQRAPSTAEELRGVRGLSRSVVDRRADDLLAAITRGRAVPENELPRFPRSPRWERDPHFDERVSRLKHVRDAVAAELGLDPGVLCPRERLEAIARSRPRTLEELAVLPELRRWQVEVMGESLVRALREEGGGKGDNGTPSGRAEPATDESPYRDA